MAQLHEATFLLEGLTCTTCSNTVTTAVTKLHGVTPETVTVTILPQNKLQLTYNPKKTTPDTIADTVEALGFSAELLKDTSIAKGDQASAQPRKGQLLLSLSRPAEDVLTALNALPGVLTATWQSISGSKSDSDPTLTLTLTLNEPLLNNGSKKGRLDVTFDERTTLRGIHDFLVDSGCGTVSVPAQDEAAVTSEGAARLKAEEIQRWRRSFLFALFFALPLTIVAMVIPWVFPHGLGLHDRVTANLDVTWREIIGFVLASPVQFVAGRRFFVEAYHSVLYGRLGMSFLVAMGTGTAYAYSIAAVVFNAAQHPEQRMMECFESSANLITFVLLGKLLEANAKATTSAAITKLVQLSPAKAVLLETAKGVEVERVIPLALAHEGDLLRIRPGEKVPLDGVVVSGNTTVDESMLTGESMAVSKSPNDKVTGGTINLDGLITMEVTSIGDNTVLSKIIKLINDAQADKPEIQAFADKAASVFVPLVLLLSALTFTAWMVALSFNVGQDWPFRKNMSALTFSILNSISVLVIACPCALGLATPTALMVGSGVAASFGILIKSGEALEAAQKVSAVVFDKTGTLTYGRPAVTDILLLPQTEEDLVHATAGSTNIQSRDREEDEFAISAELTQVAEESKARTLVNEEEVNRLVRLCASAEVGSEHPIAKGVIAKAEALGYSREALYEVTEFVNRPGLGLECMVDGNRIALGNSRLLEGKAGADYAKKVMESLEKEGKTAIALVVDERPSMVLGLMDEAKDDALVTVNLLRGMGISVFMLTGDNRRTAQFVASELGIEAHNVIAEVLPHDKAEQIRRLQQSGKAVAMIGDGINDAPGLATADLGVAIAGGTEIAIEAADIVLMNNKLTDVIVALDIARKIYFRIRLNFIWAFGYNFVGIPLAAGLIYPFTYVLVPPFVAAAAMILSSVSVITSSLLLRRYRPPKFDKKYSAKGLDKVRLTLSPHGRDEVVIEVKCAAKSLGLCVCEPGKCQCTEDNCCSQALAVQPEP